MLFLIVRQLCRGITYVLTRWDGDHIMTKTMHSLRLVLTTFLDHCRDEPCGLFRFFGKSKLPQYFLSQMQLEIPSHRTTKALPQAIDGETKISLPLAVEIRRKISIAQAVLDTKDGGVLGGKNAKLDGPYLPPC